MGGYTNISNRNSRTWPPLLFLRLALTAALSLSAAPILADSPAALAPTGETAVVSNSNPLSVEAQAVSSTARTTIHPATARAIPAAITPRPLTRAAAQLRIDEMSPVDWLSQFGSVSIGQRE